MSKLKMDLMDSDLFECLCSAAAIQTNMKIIL